MKITYNEPILMPHKWATGQRHELINVGGHEVKGQGHTRPK